MASIDKQRLSELRAFVGLLERQPEILLSPELRFFREFLERHGAKVDVSAAKDTASSNDCRQSTTPPSQDTGRIPETEKPGHEEPDEAVISEDEPDTDVDTPSAAPCDAEEADDSGRLSPEADEMPPLASEDVSDLTDEQQEKVSEFKRLAAEALEEGRLQEALEKLSAALKISPPSALMYSKRADILLRLKRPVACIRDCDEAIRLNPDSGKAYRIRGKAYRALGDWENAHKDLELGQRIDYDENVYEMQKFVAEKWKAIDTEARARQRRRDDRHRRNKLRERRRRQAAAQKEYAAQKAREETGFDDIDDGVFGGMPGAAGGFGGIPGSGAGAAPFGGMPGAAAGGDAGGLGNLLGGLMGSPAMKKAMENPKVLQALLEVMRDPNALAKYKNDPDTMAAVQEVMNSMQGK